MDISKSREPDIAENTKFMESIIHVVDNVEVSLPGQSGKRNAPISLQNVLQALQRHREGMYRLLAMQQDFVDLQSTLPRAESLMSCMQLCFPLLGHGRTSTVLGAPAAQATA